MEEQPSDSPLERMRKRLYAPRSVDGVVAPAVTSSHPSAPERWASPPPAPEAPKISGAALFLGGAALFFIVAALVTAFMLFIGGRSVSADKVAILVEGPTTVSGGEAVPLLITVKNDNPVAITGATLRLEFPEGTGEGEDPSIPLSFYEETLGDIPAGASATRTVHASFFGAEDQDIIIPVTVEYQTGNSNATFIKDITYEFTISNAPVILSVTALSEIASGQPLTLSLLVRSNSAVPLVDTAIETEYPFGFSERSVSPERESGSHIPLGTIAPGEEREVRITGTLSGQEGEERVFHFTVGALKAGSPRLFAVPYTTKDATVAIAKPFLTVGLALNRDESPAIVVKTGEPVSALLAWANALSASIQDGRITVALVGEALDTSAIDTTNGFYRSSDRTVLFDRDTAPGLGNLNPGDTGNGSFTFRTKTGSAMDALRNPAITLSVSVSGRRVGENRVPETITSTLTRTVKIQTDLALSMRAVRTVGTIENTGPWPPEADQETTYTIELEADNTVNSVASANARMTLPSYVRFTGALSAGSAITYNEATREVLWTLGDFPAGASRTASFQVALLPSVSQKGTSPTLVSDAVLRGVDRFVQKEATATAPSVDTQTNADPAYTSSKGNVLP